MNVRDLLQQEVYIRLTPDETGFLCTMKYGPLYSKTTEFRVLPAKEPSIVFKRRRDASQRDAAENEQ